MQFFEQLYDMFRAKYPVVMLHTFEHRRVMNALKAFCKEDEYTLYKWNCVEGMLEIGLSFDTALPVGDSISDAQRVLVEVDRRRDSRERELFVLEGIADYMYQPNVKALLAKLAHDLPHASGLKHVILINPLPEIPYELKRHIPCLHVPTPSASELSSLLETVGKTSPSAPSEEEKAPLVEAAAGLTQREAERIFRLLASKNSWGQDGLDLIANSKTWIPANSPND